MHHFGMKKIFICLVFAVGIAPLKSQDKIDVAVQNLEQNYNQEKVYLLLDKDEYVVGDHIFFKSFVFDGYRRSSISNTLFVELYDRNKKLVDKKTIALKNGEGNGTFNLTDALKEDVYYVRAYTAWMANFPDEFNFIQPIPIYNPSSDQKLVFDNNSQWTAAAFPESGTLVENINTKVAVRFFSQGILPEKWSGYVIDAAKPMEKITTFKSLDQNVGSFMLNPKFGKTYQVVIEDGNGKKKNIPLPVVTSSGANLHISSNDNGISYTINTNNLSDGLRDYSIVGTINNQLVYRANIKKNTAEVSSTIPTKVSDDTNAVLQLVLFNNQQQVVAKRLCFIKPKKLNISKPVFVDTSLSNDPRAFNSIDIEPDPAFPAYTVLVREKESESTNNIVSALWLTGDFTSPIFKPAQYFSANSNADALDALLISENWKRFSWDDVLQGKTPNIKYKPESNLSFKGKVTNNGIVLPNKGINLLFLSDNKETNISQTVTDDNGYLYMDHIYFEGPLKVSYYLNQDKNKMAESENLSINFQALTNNIPYRGDLPPTSYKLSDNKQTKPEPVVARAIQNRKNQQIVKAANDETLIKEVQLTAKKVDKKAELNRELSTGMFNSMNATIFDLVNENQDAQGSLNILQWLQGRVAGVTFQMDNSGNYVPSIRGSRASLYLNEMPADPSLISSISVNDIAMVKVLKDGGLVSNAILIYTKKGNMQSGPKDDKKAATNNAILNGYDKAEEFEQPDITSDAYKKVANDTRELLYWNPNLTTDSGLPARIKFFNNDNAKNREITIIGFDKNDHLLYYDEVK